jgi:hypothetical protein
VTKYVVLKKNNLYLLQKGGEDWGKKTRKLGFNHTFEKADFFVQTPDFFSSFRNDA